MTAIDYLNILATVLPWEHFVLGLALGFLAGKVLCK